MDTRKGILFYCQYYTVWYNISEVISMKKFWEFIKKIPKGIWYALAGAISVLVYFLNKSPKKEDATAKELKSLEDEQKRLQKEADEIANKKYFDNGADASDFLNDTLRKHSK